MANSRRAICIFLSLCQVHKEKSLKLKHLYSAILSKLVGKLGFFFTFLNKKHPKNNQNQLLFKKYHFQKGDKNSPFDDVGLFFSLCKNKIVLFCLGDVSVFHCLVFSNYSVIKIINRLSPQLFPIFLFSFQTKKKV